MRRKRQCEGQNCACLSEQAHGFLENRPLQIPIRRRRHWQKEQSWPSHCCLPAQAWRSRNVVQGSASDCDAISCHLRQTPTASTAADQRSEHWSAAILLHSRGEN